MMKRYLLTITVLLLFISANAQKYRTGFSINDSLCNVINAVQASAVGNYYVHSPAVSYVANVTVPPQSFTYTFNDQKFHKVFELENVLTYAYESIDLANTIDITFVHDAHSSIGIAMIKLTQPTILTQVREQASLMVKTTSVPFFYPLNDIRKRDALFGALMALVQRANWFAKTGTTDYDETLEPNWKKAKAEDTMQGYATFLSNNPNSLFRGYAAERIHDLDKTIKILDLDLGEFNINMTRTQFEEIILKKIRSYQTDDKLLKSFIQNFSFKYKDGAYGFRQTQRETWLYRNNDATSFGNEILDVVRYTRKGDKYMQLIMDFDDQITRVPNSDLINYIHIPVRIKLFRVKFDANDKVKSLDFSCILDPYQNYFQTVKLFEAGFGDPTNIINKHPTSYPFMSDWYHADFKGISKYSLSIDMQDITDAQTGNLTGPMVLIMTITADRP
ncbi:hypothetical protein [Mucilaginibacter ginsenosidivorax]|uniref:Uncharacterized protein n=1 Tax=Mucilaginibacter ginsenosidivorax TaxID=862126 RepID=A0A5B8VY40_9SPHI|nr:hypothetical protein [Mucilaginibacter ginsenosidivorax]QEC75862.1 hypothetical protein FSB76_07845 [Mucilaginibacter ginsenosidivorax]